MGLPIVAGVIVGFLGVAGGSVGANIYLTSSRNQARTEFEARFSDVTDPETRALLLDAFTHTYTRVYTHR